MFSIVIPVYNKRDTLSKTIASVLGQSVSEFELIVVDDGSTDGSLAALEGFDDPRLRSLVQRNQGPGPARNAGVAAARHDWVAFLDADDLWAECHLAELDRIRRAHPDAGLIGTDYRMSRSEPCAPEPGSPDAWVGIVDYFEAVAGWESVLCASTAAVRRDAWEESGGFGSYPNGQDSEFWVRIASRWPVAVSRRVTATYVRGTGGISDQRWQRSFGVPPKALEDLSPAVMRVLELRRGAPPDQRRSYDRFVDRYLHWRLRAAVHSGDLPTIRGLPRLYERPPSGVDRWLLMFGALPSPLARALHWAGRRARVGRLVRSGRIRLRALASRLGLPAPGR